MEKLERKLKESEKTLKSLIDIIKQKGLFEYDFVILRDATIQRFEYTFEVVWKLIKEYLYYYEGIDCNSPKSCFREAFSVKLLTAEETTTGLEMVNYRNLSTHAYNEKLADEIYSKVVSEFFELLKTIVERIRLKISID